MNRPQPVNRHQVLNDNDGAMSPKFRRQGKDPKIQIESEKTFLIADSDSFEEPTYVHDKSTDPVSCVTNHTTRNHNNKYCTTL